MDRREVEERQPQIETGANLVALVRGNAVPLVDGDDQRAAALGDHAEQARILLRDGVVRVDDADHDVRRIDGLQRLDDAELLDRFLDARAAAHAGSIDQRVATAVALERHEHRIARRARLIERDQPLLAEQSIDERRLADVRPADHGDANVVGTGAIAASSRASQARRARAPSTRARRRRAPRKSPADRPDRADGTRQPRVDASRPSALFATTMTFLPSLRSVCAMK